MQEAFTLDQVIEQRRDAGKSWLIEADLTTLVFFAPAHRIGQ